MASALPNRSSVYRRCQGFSLLELMAVMVIIGLLLALAVTSLSRSISSAEVRTAARDVMAALRYTRGQAIVKREEKTLDFNLETMAYKAPDRPSRSLPEGVEMKLLTARSELAAENVGSIRFFPDGSSTGGRVTVIAGEREWIVNVGWLTGEIAIEKDEDAL
ncbi:MAG: general secretion pathway protein GspH [Lysobacteraceae bacterium]|nr:MAG: general secretion pathway protein GspH [Xanthomonadaceae bacterium]